MNSFFQKGINFRRRKTLIMDSKTSDNIKRGKVSDNIKRGLYSTSFNSDIVPLVNLHLAKQKNVGVKQNVLQKHKNKET